MICTAAKECNTFDALIIPVDEGAGVSITLPEPLRPAVSLLCEGFTGALGELRTGSTLYENRFCTVVLTGLGSGKGNLRKRFLAMAKAFRACQDAKATEVAVLLDNAPQRASCDHCREKFAELVYLTDYEFNAYRSNPVHHTIQRVTFVTQADMDEVLREAKSCAEATCLARDVINHPAMAMTPEAFAKEARKTGARCGFQVTVLEKDQILAHKMDAFWAVAKGSAHEPRFLIMEYHGDPTSRNTIGLVGKGLMYDSGGFSLKSSMRTMFSDMGGAGAVLGAMAAIASQKLPVNVYAFVPACQNILSRDAYLPGDVITAKNGKTIEIDNTDAEGRLVLADAIVYAFREAKVDCVIDVATLTGAVGRALGNRMAGYMSNDESLAQALETASHKSCEKVWRLPLDEELFPSISSKMADIKNSAGSSNMGGGSIIGGLFLQEFTDGKPWAHLDIAAVALCESGLPYSAPGATGYGVSLLYETVKAMMKQSR